MNDKLVRVAAVTFLTGALAFAAAPAAAQYYAGASVGQFKEKESGETATGFKIFGGYEFNKNLAAEAAYVGSGTVKAAGGDFKVTGLTAAAVGTYPINDQFSLLGTVGLFHWSVSPGSISGNDIFFGAGATYNISKILGVRAEYDRYKLGGDADTTVTALSVGVQYRF